MNWQDHDFITLRDLYVAYRKAKRDAFFDPNSAHGLKFVAFEEKLTENLQLLLEDLRHRSWEKDISFIGTHRYIPKSIEPSNVGKNGIVHFCAIDPIEDWRRVHGTSNLAKVDFRLVIDATVSYMIVSALWILKVGHKYDERLDSRYAVGNRLRRFTAPDGSPSGALGKVNDISPSLFAPYFSAYGEWRQKGLQAMKTELENDQHIVAVTMDLKRFYHYVDPDFLLDPQYLEKIKVPLDEDEIAFTAQLLKSFSTWRVSTGEIPTDLGVPVGLTASSIIANVLLFEFDEVVRQKLMPVYYGRYVDDLFLVIRPGENFHHGVHFLEWLSNRLHPFVSFNKDESDPELHLKLPYAKKSKLIFVGKKQKIFELQGRTGLDLIHPIMEQIKRQSSEHRLFPELPEDESGMAIKALLVTPDATLEADALRKADIVTLRRAGFALLLSEIESHARDLEPKCWQKRRKEFYGLAERHLITPKGLFDYFRYIPRTLGLMVASKDWDDVESLLNRLSKVIEVIETTSKSVEHEAKTDNANTVDGTLLNGRSTICWVNLNRRLQESILQSFPPEAKSSQLKKILKVLHTAIPNPEDELHTLMDTMELSNKLKWCDWGRTSHAQLWLEGKLPKGIEQQSPSEDSTIWRKFLRLNVINKFCEGAQLGDWNWAAFAFPTRPIGLGYITTHMSINRTTRRRIRSLSVAFRGAWIPPSHGLDFNGAPKGDSCPNGPICPNGGHTAKCPKCPKEYRHLFIPDTQKDKVLVAVSNFKTTEKQWIATVRGDADLTLPRYEQLYKLLNDVLKEKPRPEYLVLPEFSLPRKWMMPVAQKLSVNKISLLAGLEYERAPEGLKNEALISLTTNFAGYPSHFCLKQQKLAPAWDEERKVRDRLGIGVARPAKLFRPVYVHGGFHFGVLLCSDFTDIRNRSHFQGWIDALFVLEWNRDLNTFSSLVESGALDLHAFVIQANNREYGDSRIRAPYREDYKRDLVRVKGGVHDYFVIGEIDFKSLRNFQSSSSPEISEKALFKPFPIGFEISPLRRIGSKFGCNGS